MSERGPTSDNLWALLNAGCDGNLTDVQIQELESLLGSDSALRRLFIHHVQLRTDIQLLCRAEKACDDGLARVQTVLHQASQPVSPAPNFFSTTLHTTLGYFSEGMPLAYLLATVIVGVGLLIGSRIYVSGPEQVAGQLSPAIKNRATHDPQMPFVGRITGMVDCQWADPTTAVPGPVAVPLGRKYALASGLMEITYNTGAKVILQGPCTYEVESAAGGYLSVGRLTAKVEKKIWSTEYGVRSGGGRGAGNESSVQHSALSVQNSPSNPQSLIPNPLFAVRTPAATVTDLGTEFGVTVAEDGLTQIHVLQGVVEAQSIDAPGNPRRHERLTEGNAVQIRPKSVEIEAVAFTPRPFTRKLQAARTAVETAYGSAVLTDKPLAYWPLNEPTGSRKFVDRSGNGFDGWAMNKVVVGRAGPLRGDSRAVALDGDGNIDIGRHDEFARITDLTIEAWVCIGEIERFGQVLSAASMQNEGRTGWALAIQRRGSSGDVTAPAIVRFITYGGNFFDFRLSGNEASEGRWFHIALVYDRTNTAHCYLNGAYRESVRGRMPRKNELAWINIGSDPLSPDECWHGGLGHVAIYPYALSARQIAKHFDQQDAEQGD